MKSVSGELLAPGLDNTAAVIVAYYPDEHFVRRLENLGDQFAAVYCVDNTPAPDAAGDYGQVPGVHYLPCGFNAGLARALNKGCRAAHDAGYQWVVTFDQDSDIVADFLSQHIDSWLAAKSPVFMLGCNYADSAGAAPARFREGGGIVTCATVITSGCLMNLSLWQELGEFRDDYFIDGIDHEFCLRGRSKGLVVARHGRVLMKHRIGERSSNLRIFPYLHGPVRKYYGIRNGVRNVIQYAAGEPAWAARKIASMAWEIVVALLIEPDRRRKSRAMIRGLRDGVRGRMGVAAADLSG